MDPGDHLPLWGGVTEPMRSPDNLLSALRSSKRSWRNAGCCCWVYHQDRLDIPLMLTCMLAEQGLCVESLLSLLDPDDKSSVSPPLFEKFLQNSFFTY
ncbi:MAG: hypothetical protein JRG73_14620 [Deltaproteobacteria bacterium]|nr:hypothetical protein [Deltaproteobacteria bacterium]MBW2308158.1 hypothetical protein [Deltaproteobacteria bacterium]